MNLPRSLCILSVALGGWACRSAPDEPEALPPAPDVIVPVKGFTCERDAVGSSGHDFHDVAGRPGDRLALRPAQGPCQFDLLLRAASGAESVLSLRSGGFLIAASSSAPGGGAAICVSNIVHSPDSKHAEEGVHEIHGVSIECAVERAGVWSPLATIVPPEGSAAAWVGGLRVAGDSLYAVGWVRDFSFQLLNLDNAGRPPDDGVYETTFAVEQGTVTVGATQKLRDHVVAPSDVVAEPWDGK